MQVEIDSFTEIFTVLHKKGLPSPLGSNEHLMRHIEYMQKLNKYVVDQVNASSSTSTEKALPSRQALYDKLEILFYIEHEVKHLFTIPPNFFRYTEIDETLRKLQRHKLPESDWWQDMLGIL